MVLSSTSQQFNLYTMSARHEAAVVTGDKVSVVRSPSPFLVVVNLYDEDQGILTEPLFSRSIATRSDWGIGTGYLLHLGRGSHDWKFAQMDAYEKVSSLSFRYLKPAADLWMSITALLLNSVDTGELASSQTLSTQLTRPQFRSAPHPSEAKIHLRIQMYGE